MKRIFEKLQEMINTLVKRKEVKGYCEHCGKPLKEKFSIRKYSIETGKPVLYVLDWSVKELCFQSACMIIIILPEILLCCI